MEGYYHKNPRIEESVEQIIDKIFTTSILSGVDSEEEFQEGCLIIAKTISDLQGFPTFPTGYLEEGIKQILAHQLPHPRVINNFPDFLETMNKMIHEGFLKVDGPALMNRNDKMNVESLEHMITTHKREESNESSKNQTDLETKLAVLEKNATETTLEISIGTNIDIESESLQKNSSNDDSLTSLFKSKKQIPEKAFRLNDVLGYIFPNVKVHWNITLMGQKFLAQVDNILIVLYDPTHPCVMDEFQREGWKVLIFREEDLSYPRRLERGIKNINRSGKKL